MGKKTSGSSIPERLTAVEVTLGNVSEKVGELYDFMIIGKGEPSIKTQVGNHEIWINNQKDKQKIADERSWAVKLRVIGEFIAIIALIILNLLNLSK